jgi:hypothetical protein
MKFELLCLSMNSCFDSAYFDLSGGAGYRRDWNEVQILTQRTPHVAKNILKRNRQPFVIEVFATYQL